MGPRAKRPSRRRRSGSVAPVALFLPGVAAVVIAVALPEARLIHGGELDPAEPLRALPRVEARHDEAQRVAVLGRERLAVGAKCQQAIVALRELDRRVRGEAVLAVRDHKLRFGGRLRELDDLGEGDALPLLVEPAPS